MLNLTQSEHDFLNSEIYANFRSLICSERILISNVYFRFNKLDLRPLLAGCLICKWDESEKMFMPEKNMFNTILLNGGALEIVKPISILDLQNYVGKLRPKKDLIIAQQGALVNEHKLYTDMCIYNDGNKQLVSIIREGLEGFNFDLTKENFDAHQLAHDKEIKLIHSEALYTILKSSNELFEVLKNEHNESIKINLSEVKLKMKEHVSSNLSITIDNPDELPTFIALKLCGPVCWYFNRFVQSCLGLHAMNSCFQHEQLELIENINIISAKTRNMGLKLSRSQKDKDRISLEKLINTLIDQIEFLDALLIH